MNFIKLEIKRRLENRITLSVVVLYLLFYSYINYKMGNIYFISNSNFYMRLFFLSPDTIETTNFLYFILPIMAALIGSDVLAEDLRSKWFINVISRYNAKKYYYSCCFVSFLCSGFVMVIPYIIDFIIKIAIYPINYPSITMDASFPTEIGMSSIFVYHPMIYTLLAILFTFLFSGLVGLIGFTVSLFTTKKLIISSSPFILNIIVWNIVNIFGIKSFTIDTILIFRIVQNMFSLKELILFFILSSLVVFLIIYLSGKKYDFI